MNLEDKTVTAKVTVKNTGDVAGKDVVTVCIRLIPYTEYDKEHAVEKAADTASRIMKKQVCCSREESVTVEDYGRCSGYGKLGQHM